MTKIFLPKGSWFEAVDAAVHDAIEKYTRPGKDKDGNEIRVPIPQNSNNFGAEFDYGISRKSIEESINEEQIKKSLDGEASRGVHLAVLNHLDKVIGESIEIEEHPDYIKKNGKRNPENGFNENILVHRFVGAIKVDGKEYRVKTTMLEYKQADMASREYAYDVTKIEVLDDTTPNTPDDLDRAAKGLLPLAKVIKNLEKSYDSGKKILDESKNADESTDLYRDPDEAEDIQPLGRAATERGIADFERETGIAGAVEISSAEQIPETLDKDTPAWYDNSTGKVHIIPERVGTAANAKRILFHELKGHKGINELIGEERLQERQR